MAWINLKFNSYKIFCDESNHLFYDKSNIMVNGAILVPEKKICIKKLFP